MAASNNISLLVSLSGVQQTVAGLRSVATSIGAINSKVNAVVGLALAFAGLNKVEDSVKKVIDLGGELSHLKAIGTGSIRTMLALKEALQDTGGAAGDSAILIRFMQRNIDEALTGGGEAARVFTQLNLSLSELSRMNVAERVRAIGQAFNEYNGSLSKSTLATEIFGKAGTQMIAVFEDGEAFDSLSKGAGLFGEVMARNAKVLDDIGDRLHRVSEFGMRFFAGVLDQLPLDRIESAMKQFIDDFDFTAIGQKFGAFVNVAIDQWRAGKLDEFIALTIAAGIEQAKELWRQFAQFIRELMSSKMAEGIQKGVFEALAAVVKGWATFVLDATQLVMSSFGSVFVWVGDQFRWVFQGLGNSLSELLQDVLNGFFGAISKGLSLLGIDKTFKPTKFERNQVAEPMSLGESFDATYSKVSSAGITEKVMAGADHVLNAARELLGIQKDLPGAVEAETQARDRLKALVDAQLATRKEVQEIEQRSQSAPPFNLNAYKEMLAITEKVIANTREQFDLERAKIAASNLPEDKKESLLSESLAQEKQLILDQIAALETRQALLTDTSAIQAGQKTVDQLMGQVRRVELEQVQSAARLREAEYRVNQERLHATSGMFQNMATAAKAFGKEGFAAYKAFAIASAVVDTAAAAIAAYRSVVNIPYVGPILAPIAAAAAVAAGAAQIANISAQTLAAGGPVVGPGSSTSDSVPAWLSNGEYVVNAAAANQIGRENLDMINQGQLPVAARPVPVVSNGSQESKGMSFIFVDDRSKALAALNTAEGEAKVVDIMSRNMHRFRR